MSRKRVVWFWLNWCWIAAATVWTCDAQTPVIVSIQLEESTIDVGETTELSVFARIDPALQADTDRIFSWYVDLVHTNGAVALARYDLLTRPDSDNDSALSSSGLPDGTSRVAIYDTFLNRPDAGRLSPVKLFSVPVEGLADGQTTFRVRPGTGEPRLADDFVVAPAGGGASLTGGDYSGAFVSLTVGEEISGPGPEIRIERTATQDELLLTFPVQAGENYWLEYADVIDAGSWAALPGGPFNDGQLIIGTGHGVRFFRVRVGGAAGPSAPLLQIGLIPGGDPQVNISFNALPNIDYRVEYQDALNPGAPWQVLPNGPHNSGDVSAGADNPTRFYRLKVLH